MGQKTSAQLDDNDDALLEALLEASLKDLKNDLLIRKLMERIHCGSKSRILGVAEKIRANAVLDEPDFIETKEILPLERQKWGFQLGDKVRIKCTPDEYKLMSKKCLGWNKPMMAVHGFTGIITTVLSQFANLVIVFFEEFSKELPLFAGVLEKVEDSDKGIVSRWKLGDKVETHADEMLLKLLQRGFDDIPDQLIGKKGQVIGIAKKYVLVTFDGKHAYVFNPASLLECGDGVDISDNKVVHPRGFKVDDEVRMTSNLKKLVENQSTFGGWDDDMTPLKGQIVRILNIQEDHSLNVQLGCDRPWRVSPDSVMKLDESEEKEDDLDFLPGDIAYFKLPSKYSEWMKDMEIPKEFKDILELPKTIKGVDDDIDYVIQVNNQQLLVLSPSFLTKSTPEQKRKQEAINSKVKSLKPGDTVYLDVGPKNYVKAILIAEKDPNIVTALTESSKLLGFIDYKTAVIQYENGLRYKINKKYLTVPEKFDNSSE